MKLNLVVSALLVGYSVGQNVVEVAVSMPETFSTLVSFVQFAQLATTLSETQGITVFAPTDAAFAGLIQVAPEVVTNLGDAQWSTHLQNVLLNHVLPVEVPSKDVTDGLTATALSGEELTFGKNSKGAVSVGAAKVEIADVEASNGVIHVIDNVLIPSWVTNSIVDRAAATPALSTLVQLVGAAGLEATLKGPGPFTVFAPTNDAFVKFLDGADIASLDIEEVKSILLYHVVSGIAPAAAITDGLMLPTVQGEDITFSLMGDAAMVNGENIVLTDILANNGIVHVIDEVLTMPSMDTPEVPDATTPPTKKKEDTMPEATTPPTSSSSRTSFAAAATVTLLGFGVAIGNAF